MLYKYVLNKFWLLAELIYLLINWYYYMLCQQKSLRDCLLLFLLKYANIKSTNLVSKQYKEYHRSVFLNVHSFFQHFSNIPLSEVFLVYFRTCC